MRFSFLIAFLLSFSAFVPSFGQGQPIKLRNPSFEDVPRMGANDRIAPRGWFDCGKPGESAPDVHPAMLPDPPHFGVRKESQHGNTYMGMVTRDNDTWEAVAQRTSAPIVSGQCYEFDVFLARSPIYYSFSRTSDRRVNFADPIVLRIWGGNDYCNKREMLAESGLIENYEWKNYKFRFKPKGDYTFITFEAYYKTPALFTYNGNVLVDNASDIVPIPCDKPEEEEIMPPPEVTVLMPLKSGDEVEYNDFNLAASVLNVETKSDIRLFFNNREQKNFSFNKEKSRISANVILSEGNNSIRVEGRNKSGRDFDSSIVVYQPPVVVVSPEPEPPVQPSPSPGPESYDNLPPEFEKEIIPVGSIITLKDIVFPADSFNVHASCIPILNDLYSYLKSHPEMSIEVGGHTNNLCDSSFCNQLSEARAKSVADFLINKGISASRLQYKGYGSRNPVASNRTASGRKKNQRVEIKVIKT